MVDEIFKLKKDSRKKKVEGQRQGLVEEDTE
jgi:hypothetical protein